MMKIATVYERDDRWYFQPSSKTTNGLWIAAPPLQSVDRECEFGRKGQLVFNTLEESKTGVPIPTDPKVLISPLLEATGVKSWATFMNKAKCISVECDGGELKMIPQRKINRPRGALESMPEQAIVLIFNSPPESVGEALAEAMKRSE